MRNASSVHIPSVGASKFFALTFAIALCATVGASWSARNAQAESLGFSIEPKNRSELDVKVLDDLTQEPIADAQIGISALPVYVGGTRLDPFGKKSYELLSKTSSQGAFFVKRAGVLPKILTVAKPGYSSLTLAGVQSGKVTVYLKRLETAFPDVMASGSTDGWLLGGRSLSLSKPIALGLVIRSLSGFDLLSFNLQSLVSPINDGINAWGWREIPSNLVIPSQIIPSGLVRVNKPNYRLPVPAGYPSRLAVVQGMMTSMDLFQVARSGNLDYASLNLLEFMRVGLSQPVSPTGHFHLDLNAEMPLSEAHQVTVTAPDYSADVMVAALADLNGDRSVLLPTDLKAPISSSNSAHQNYVTPNPQRVSPTTVALKSMPLPPGAGREVVGIAVTPDNKKFSGIIAENPGSQVELGAFLPVPTLADQPQLPESLTLPHAKQGLSQAVFEIARPARPQGVPQHLGSETFGVWTIYALPTAGAVTIKTASLGTNASLVKAISVLSLEFSKDFEESRIDGLKAIQDLRRFSRVTAQIGAKTRR